MHWHIDRDTHGARSHRYFFIQGDHRCLITSNLIASGFHNHLEMFSLVVACSTLQLLQFSLTQEITVFCGVLGHCVLEFVDR